MAAEYPGGRSIKYSIKQSHPHVKKYKFLLFETSEQTDVYPFSYIFVFKLAGEGYSLLELKKLFEGTSYKIVYHETSRELEVHLSNRKEAMRKRLSLD